MKCVDCKFRNSSDTSRGNDKFTRYYCGLELPPQYAKTLHNTVYRDSGCSLGQKKEKHLEKDYTISINLYN